MTSANSPSLLLDEMYHPTIATTLCEQGFDVIAVVADPRLRSASDSELFETAILQNRWVVTENVKDFKQLAAQAEAFGQPCAGLIFVSSRAFHRSRHNLGSIIAALSDWLTRGYKDAIGGRDWLRGPPQDG